MGWVALILSVLKILSSLTVLLNKNGWITEGVTQEQEAELARVMSELAATNKARLNISKIEDSDLDTIAGDQGWVRKD